MAILTISKLETTEAGTTDVQAVINDNWLGLEEIFNPATAGASPVYDLPARALLRGAVPTKRARLEWLPGSPAKAIFRPVHETITYAGTITFQLDTGAAFQTCVLTGNLIVQLSTLAEGQEVTLYLEASGGARTPTWPASVRWLSGAAPGAIPSGKILAVTFRSRGTVAGDVVATYELEP